MHDVSTGSKAYFLAESMVEPLNGTGNNTATINRKCQNIT